MNSMKQLRCGFDRSNEQVDFNCLKVDESSKRGMRKNGLIFFTTKNFRLKNCDRWRAVMSGTRY
jgi:hypothetical protein